MYVSSIVLSEDLTQMFGGVKSMYTHKEIAAAAIRLSESNVLGKIDWEMKHSGEESPRLLPLVRPHLKDILVMIEAGKVIAETHGVMPEIEYKDYHPGNLSAHLCQRFSELPQYVQAPSVVKKVVWGLGNADIIGIYLAGDSERFVAYTQGIDKTQRQQFHDWVKSALSEAKITFDDPRIADFQPYAALTMLLRCSSMQDTFQWLSKNPDCLKQEVLQKSDCDQLVGMNINKTADLAQTSVLVLEEAFGKNSVALQRLSMFLAKRHLGFGMRFPIELQPCIHK